MRMNKKAQIWVETVIYTLIALSLIGATLAFVKPKIQEMQDKAIIEQSIEIMDYIDSTVFQIVRGGAGNTRTMDISLKKGELQIDSINDQILFIIDNSRYEYSQEGKKTNIGNVNILTESKNKLNRITLSLNYSNYDILFENEQKIKTLTGAPVPYKVLFGNQGAETIPGSSEWVLIGSNIQIVLCETNVITIQEDIVPSLIPVGTYSNEEYKLNVTTNALEYSITQAIDGEAYGLDEDRLVSSIDCTLYDERGEFPLINIYELSDIPGSTGKIKINTEIVG